MSTKREERERLRQERLAAQQAASSAERRRMMIGYVVAGLIVLAIIAGVVVAVAGGGESSTTVGNEEVSQADLDAAGVQPASGLLNDYAIDTREGSGLEPLAQGSLERAAEAAGCQLRLALPEEGRQHLGPDDEPPDYGTSPATSGDHVGPNAQADGAYADEVEPRHYVHSLEHGRVAIAYSPRLGEEEQLQLKGLFDESPDGMLLFPARDMPYEVAAVAWTQLIGCERFEGQATIDALRDFRDVYQGAGPEPVPLSL